MMRPALILKRLARRLGYHVGRLPNRFDAMDDALRAIAVRGFHPDLVIDAGANVGEWSLLAASIWPAARMHLIEPQPACHPILQHLSAERGWSLHPVALASPGVSRVAMINPGPDSTSPGAWVRPLGEGGLAVPAATLTALVGDAARTSDRPILKLDLEGYELPALTGAIDILPFIEVIVTEVRFYDIENGKRTVFDDLFVFLREHGFRFYDVARLAGRPRDNRPALGDVIFVREATPLLADVRWH